MDALSSVPSFTAEAAGPFLGGLGGPCTFNPKGGGVFGTPTAGSVTYAGRESVVERRRAIGTFVSTPKIHFNKLMSYTEQVASRSMTAVSKVLFAKIIDDE